MNRTWKAAVATRQRGVTLVGHNETSADGMWRLEEVECLGACGYGPMLQMGKDYYEHLTIEKVDALIEEWSQSE